MHHCTRAPVIRRSACCALLGLLAWIGGCNQPPRSAEHAEVSGKVLIDGKPLSGGQISFVAVKGGFAASGNIDENGQYKINAPVGEVTITVNNTSQQSQQGQPPRKGAGKGGGGGGPPPKDLPHPKQGAEEHLTKGHWVSIPSRYSNADTSDLKYTVTPGAQTHDVQLSSAAPPPK